MDKDKYRYKILLVEDNPGDAFLVEEYIEEYILDPDITLAHTFARAKELLSSGSDHFEVILLDLTLPDNSGRELVSEMLQLGGQTPIIILTGYTDISFSLQALKLGISDYMIKDKLSGFSLYKAIIHNIDRTKFIDELKQSQERYSSLFQLSPQPMWVYDEETLEILDVNKASTREYGFSNSEFLEMKISDIVYSDEMNRSGNVFKSKDQLDVAVVKNQRHILKNGEVIDVEIYINDLNFGDKNSKVILSNNITERALHIKAIEEQNTSLRDIAWIQSHIVRAPLARLMGLVELMKDDIVLTGDQFDYIGEIMNSANELDEIIKDISSKTSNVKIEIEKGKI